MVKHKSRVEQAPQPQQEAQQRADRIQAFWQEMEALEQEQALVLPEDQRRALRVYHDHLLSSFSRQFEVDTTKVQKQLSLGMRIVSLLGAMAFSTALFFFMYHFWGNFSIPVRVAILMTTPLLVTVAVELTARRERILYFAPMLGLLAFTGLALNLYLFRELFNLTPSAAGLLALAAFAFILAYTYNLRFLLIAGLISFMCYLSASFGAFRGGYWLSLGQRPEDFILAGLIIAALSVAPQQKYPAFPRVYRVVGLLAVFLAILFLASYGHLSYFPFSHQRVEHFYQVAGFVVAGGVIWLGVGRRLQDVVILGNVFFVIFLYTRFFAWWWDWLPAYLFFLILGAAALLILFYLKWLRRLTQEPRP
ncbi:MAG: DUF2157 domain-containing protein [Deltaproteobacteria bacterium]|nr:DUF2157 domain-containing protein [Deltaproteobacteria bacterium]